jgi:hypothetical protein
MILMLSACGARKESPSQPAPPPEAVPSPSAGAEGAKAGSAGVPLNSHILVDQFGYRPQDPKVAVIRDPHEGFDARDRFSAGAHYEIRRANDGEVVYSGKPAAWNDGAVEESSGDSGWWFDFSSLNTPGAYFVYDADRKARSPVFTIDEQVYKKILKAAMRVFFYQRSGFAKRPPYAEACWVDDAAYMGPDQDTQARDITDPRDPAKVRDLGGGWFDAGDTNKYVTFAVQPVHQLLTAYQENPKAFTDDFNIPESGNGIPDVIDEVKWETDWLKKMQYPDGSAALKVGDIVYTGASPPSSDTSARFYVPACTSSTIAVAGMFAHAAYVYRRFPSLAGEAKDLETRALKAWSNYQENPVKQTHCDQNIVKAGNADLSESDQAAQAAEAAIYLYAVTGDAVYDKYIEEHYRDMRPYHDMGWSRYKPDEGESLLFYTTLGNANAELKNAILSDKRSDVRMGNKIYGFSADDDLYRNFLHAPQYHWGSNNPRACYGTSNMDVITYHIDTGDTAPYRNRALDTLHYFHGVNPFGMVYLSNMYALGATRSANRIYHTWYSDGSKWADARGSQCGPPPGYVPGGPNASAAANGVPASLSPPARQPAQKSYRDWNTVSEASWTVTEPGIYYQSAYVKLLSAFVQ